MPAVQTRADGLLRELRVIVPAGDVHDQVERRLATIAQSVRLPGFRSGKVPLTVVRERYGKSVIREVVEHAVAESSKQALSEHRLRPALPATVRILSGPERGDLEYALTVEVLPEIPPLDAAALELERLVADGGPVDAASAVARAAARRSRAHLKRQLLDTLAARYDFPVPPSLVEREFGVIWGAAEELRREERTDPGGDPKSDEAVRAELRGIAERRVRLGLLLAEIGRLSCVEVTQEDLDRALVEEASQSSITTEKVRARYRGNPEATARLRTALLEDKVVDVLVARAKVTERIVPLAELVREET
jgi:FKBP-type peptidyl-prolyl cis-trans isomerase (trigger factor)